MVIGIQNYLNAGVQTVQAKDENDNYFWVKMFNVQKKSGVKTICDLGRKEIMGIVGVKDFKNYKRSLQEITNNINDNSEDKYIRNDIAEKFIKNCRGVKKCKNFKILLGFKEHDIFLTKEQSVFNKITTVFARCEIYLQYSVLDYRIVAWFPKYKLAIEIDELGHFDRDNEKEKVRKNKAKQKLQCKFIRINPDKEGFDIFVELVKISNYIEDAIIKKFINSLVVNKVDVDDSLSKEINKLSII